MTLPRKRTPALAAFCVGGAAALLLLAACAPTPSDAGDGDYAFIPTSTNRPSDPPAQSSESQTPQSEAPDGIPAEGAPLEQLWAAANSEAGKIPTSTPGVGLADFSEAIAAQCYPQLVDAEKTELDGLKAAYQSVTGTEAAEPAHAYFVRATELCM